MTVPPERRKYIRLNLVFPISFQSFLFGQPQGRIYQGFTRNVSFDGLCIEIAELDPETQNNLRNPQLKLLLMIEMPLSSQPTRAIAKVAWVETTGTFTGEGYLIGIDYEDIDQKAKRRIFSYAKRVRNIGRYVTAAMITLVATTALSLACEFQTRRENRLLVERSVQLAKRYGQLERKIQFTNRKEAGLKQQIEQSIVKQRQVEMQLSQLEEMIDRRKKPQDIPFSQLSSEREELEQTLSALKAERAVLEDEVEHLIHEKTSLDTDLTLVKQESQGLTQTALQNMYRWLKAHQAHTTGLVTSFEGDKFLENWAFTYDQSLSAQVFTLFGDYERVRRILNFYKYRAEKSYGGFVNAYEVDKGLVSEYTVHCGPNIWLGIAILQYTAKSQDAQYINLARAIGDWIINIQSQDREFGIRGGPRASWFSTEHNLDAYAFFNMLHTITKESRYLLAAQHTLEWLKTHAYSGSGPPINRGKGDATIATDTFSWAICALGPQKLLQDGMDPEQIIQYAEDNCAVTVEYQRPKGERVKICGFDFSKFTHLPRGGVVSTEWTGQMIVAYRIMADYFFQQHNLSKARRFHQKADFYLNELSKMFICSPSKIGRGEGCLPYATAAYADTGHGWRTPQGDRTGSLAATAYAIFATINYNPFSLDNQNGSSIFAQKVSLSKSATRE